VIFGIDVASILLGGMAAGMVLFIVSVGLSVTMGLMGFVNLAHGGFAMIGGYVIVLSMNRLGVSFIPALALGFVLTAAFSVVLERLLYSRLYRAAELDQVLFTIGLVFIMIAGVTLLVGPENQQIQLPEMLRGQMDLGFTRYRTYSVVLILVGISFVVALWLGFERTRMGAQIRAAVDNRRMTESLGINVNRLFTLTFAFGSGMAAVGGGLGAEFLGLDPQYALKYLVFFLIVVAVGGLGRVTGVFYAAALIGVLDFVLKQYVPRGGTLYIYALTILLLLWRPQGLFGRGAGATGGEKEDSSVTLMGFGVIGFIGCIGWWLAMSPAEKRPFFEGLAHQAGLLGWNLYPFLAALAATAACAVVGFARIRADKRARQFLLGLMRKLQPAPSSGQYGGHPAALAFSRRHHPRAWEALPWILALACYFLFPTYLPFGTEVLVIVLFALSLDLALGYAGIITLGHAAFFGIGAYVVGMLSVHAGWTEPISGLVFAAIIAGVMGLISGWVLLRTSGLTLLMLTLCFAVLLEELSNQFGEYTGGFDGKNLAFDPILGLFEFDQLSSKSQYLYVLAVLFVMFLIIRSIVNSPFGQSLTGIRENILRMPAVGTPVRWRLVLAYSMSAAVAGVAGALLAQASLFVNQTFLSLERSAAVIIILILGGYGRLYGAFVGAIAYMALAHFLSKAYPTAWQLGLGALLVVIALFARNGVLGIGERLAARIGAQFGRKPA
jgi:ABC-type branched-subunit amino acid transport system permease subunit